jgi:hypothetical protein
MKKIIEFIVKLNIRYLFYFLFIYIFWCIHFSTYCSSTIDIISFLIMLFWLSIFIILLLFKIVYFLRNKQWKIYFKNWLISIKNDFLKVYKNKIIRYIVAIVLLLQVPLLILSSFFNNPFSLVQAIIFSLIAFVILYSNLFWKIKIKKLILSLLVFLVVWSIIIFILFSNLPPMRQ